MSETGNQRRDRVLKHTPAGFEDRVGRMTSEETTAAAAHLLENMTFDEIFDALMVALDEGDREELAESLKEG